MHEGSPSMRTLVYKRNHHGDPDPVTGRFGCFGCMGRVRGYSFDAVIGIGGTGLRAKRAGIAERLTWIGVSPMPAGYHEDRYPVLAFSRYWYKGEKGPLLKKVAPHLARRMYGNDLHFVIDDFSENEMADIKRLLRRAKAAAPSSIRGAVRQVNTKAHNGCGSKRC
jgi:hypothetical protein